MEIDFWKLACRCPNKSKIVLAQFESGTLTLKYLEL